LEGPFTIVPDRPPARPFLLLAQSPEFSFSIRSHSDFGRQTLAGIRLFSCVSSLQMILSASEAAASAGGADA
jgi:hypothetical protein